MTTTFVHEAGKAVESNTVQAILKTLSRYGLGVCVPHAHDERTGAFTRLPNGMVQSESDLKISFVERSSLDDQDVPVAWVWDDGAQVVQSCQTCRVDGPHH
jgi:hypothetical protein